MLYLYHLSVLGADERHGVVAVGELVAFLSRHLLNPRLAVDALGVHGHECLHAVATMYVEVLCDRAEAVGGIHVAAELLVVVESPAELVVDVLLPISVPER